MTIICLSLIPLSTPLHSSLPFPSSNPFPLNSPPKFNYHPKCAFQFGPPLTKIQFPRKSLANDEEGGSQNSTVESLKVPDHWSEPSFAMQESEWLRVSLHKWLDDEYCPEPTNVDISRIAANSYYQSLLRKTTDLGDILLRMAKELESISYQESFHGPFSAANAAVSLIVQRLENA